MTHNSTLKAYYIGYSEIHNINNDEQGKCTHSIKDLEPTKNWFPIRDIHKQVSGGSWESLFDYSHILEGAPIAADIELKCIKCKTLFYTKNAYHVGFSEIYYVNLEEQGKCNHSLHDMKPTKRW